MLKKLMLLLVFLQVIPVYARNSPQLTVDDLDAVYQMPTYGIEFHYPSGWTSTGIEGNTGIFEGESIAPLRIVVFVQSLEQAGLEAHSKIDAFVEKLSATTDFMPIGETPILSRRAVILAASVTEKGNLAYNNFYAAYWIQQGMVFTFIYSVPELNDDEQFTFEQLLEGIQPIIVDDIKFAEEPFVWAEGGLSIVYPVETVIDLDDGWQFIIEAPTTTEAQFMLSTKICAPVHTQGDIPACYYGSVVISRGQQEDYEITSADDIPAQVDLLMDITPDSDLEYYREEFLINGRVAQGVILPIPEPDLLFLMAASFDEATSEPYWYAIAMNPAYFSAGLYMLESIQPVD